MIRLHHKTRFWVYTHTISRVLKELAPKRVRCPCRKNLCHICRDV